MANMVDVGGKDITRRTAVAAGRIRLGAEAFDRLTAGTLPKGDALATAKVAAIQAVKRTPGAIPLCHPIPIDQVAVVWETDAGARTLEVTVTVRAQARTGVEMEALHGVSVFLLTLYDMTKSIDKSLAIERIRLESKSGGRSGDWRRDDASAAGAVE
jgi:cyclic pyranopterin phosphate synthase